MVHLCQAPECLENMVACSSAVLTDCRDKEMPCIFVDVGTLYIVGIRHYYRSFYRTTLHVTYLVCAFRYFTFTGTPPLPRVYRTFMHTRNTLVCVTSILALFGTRGLKFYPAAYLKPTSLCSMPLLRTQHTAAWWFSGLYAFL
jgi:hypothetical protein